MPVNKALKFPTTSAMSVATLFYDNLCTDRAEDVDFIVNGKNLDLLLAELAKHDDAILEVKKLMRQYHFNKQ